MDEDVNSDSESEISDAEEKSKRAPGSITEDEKADADVSAPEINAVRGDLNNKTENFGPDGGRRRSGANVFSAKPPSPAAGSTCSTSTPASVPIPE